jgi:hypothetical protein
MVNAILINAKDRTITKVTFETLEDIYRLLGVEIIENVWLHRGNCMYIDEEGRLKDYKTGFEITIPDINKMDIVGNGLVLSIDDDGSDSDTNLTLEEVVGMVEFLTYE